MAEAVIRNRNWGIWIGFEQIPSAMIRGLWIIGDNNPGMIRSGLL
jgi:hypothetical protein